ncbi:MAG: flgK [Paucimonas sp.]|nr:flgK [Paucimonas sp.]
MAITDKSQIALATPIKTTTPSGNTGTGKISAGVLMSSTFVAGPTTLSYDATAGEFSGFPAGEAIVARVNGVATNYVAGSAIPYTPPSEMVLEFGGVSVTISGTPADGDQFTVGPNASGAGDNRNGLLLSRLQSSNTLDGGTASYQGAYSQLTNLIGNKTRELEVTTTAAGNQHRQAVAAQQAESGVNLDEEATNLIRYQQAYQAAAKVMQAANTMFDVLLNISR